MKFITKLTTAACLLAAAIQPLQAQQEINDMTTPLHLLDPAYQIPYGDLTTEAIKTDLDRILSYLEATTPVRVLDKGGKEITDYKKIGT